MISILAVPEIYEGLRGKISHLFQGFHDSQKWFNKDQNPVWSDFCCSASKLLI